MTDENDELLVDVRSQPDRSPQQIERLVLSLSDSTPVDDLCAAIDACDWLLGRAKAIQALCKQQAVSWIEHNGEFAVGDLRYSVGYYTTTKCRDLHRCGHSLLEAVEGDFDRFLASLCSQPYKHGYARSLLDQRTYRSLFESKSTGRLINGVPERTLVRRSSRFG